MTRKLELLLGAALAAIAPATAAYASGPHNGGTAIRSLPRNQDGTGFRPPENAVLLTRELRKTLSDGHQFISRRHYALRFLPRADGYLVEGDLIRSEVESPPELAPLAEMERTRRDTGLFPLRLDRNGMILAETGPESSPEASPLDSAPVISAAAAYLKQGAVTQTDRAAALTMVSHLQAQARTSGTNWPIDVFHPAPGERTEIRELEMPGTTGPGGLTGKVTITLNASKAPSGLLERFQRQVVTELAGTRRLSVETWTLASAR